LLTPLTPLCIEAPADVVGGNRVASLGARLRVELWKPFDDELKALSDRSWERCAIDRPGTSVAGDAFSVNVSFVFVRAGVFGMSMLISGRGGRKGFCSRPSALFDEDAMINRQDVVLIRNYDDVIE
jgi:hypothetical protein